MKKATLRVFTKSTITTSGLELRPVTGGDWSESGATYRSAPTVGPAAAEIDSGPSGQWVSIDATSPVKGNDTISLA